MRCSLVGLLAAVALPGVAAAQQKQQTKPNIVIIWGDDIGYWNVSAYNQGMIGYRRRTSTASRKKARSSPTGTAKTYARRGRACSSPGRFGFRTGIAEGWLAGCQEGLQARDVTIAQLLKAQGYMTAPFGKNHLGDADATLPTMHGFDEFFGSLYHLNAERGAGEPRLLQGSRR